MFLGVLGVCRLCLLCNLLGFQTALAVGIPPVNYASSLKQTHLVPVLNHISGTSTLHNNYTNPFTGGCQ